MAVNVLSLLRVAFSSYFYLSWCCSFKGLYFLFCVLQLLPDGAEDALDLYVCVCVCVCVCV